MKICYLLTRSDALGGVQIHIRHLAKKMAEEGHEVTIIVGGTGVYYELLLENGCNVISIESLKKEINIFSDTLAFFQLLICLIRVKPDLISIHSSKAGVIGRVASFILRIPSVFTAHGWSFTDGISKRKQYITDYYFNYKQEPTRTITIPYDLIGIIEYIINNKLNLKDINKLLNDESTTFDGMDGKFSFKNNVITRELNILKISNGEANLVK